MNGNVSRISKVKLSLFGVDNTIFFLSLNDNVKPTIPVQVTKPGMSLLSSFITGVIWRGLRNWQTASATCSQLSACPQRCLLKVLPYQSCIHANKLDRKCVCEEFLLNSYGFNDDMLNDVRMRTVFQAAEEEAGKVCMHSLVTGNELVGES